MAAAGVPPVPARHPDPRLGPGRGDRRAGGARGGRAPPRPAGRRGRPRARGRRRRQLDTADAALVLARLREPTASRPQAQLRLLLAGARPEDIRQAEAQLAAAAGRRGGREAELASAEVRPRALRVPAPDHSGSRKQRDDAVTRRDLARARLDAAKERVVAARETLARLRAGARKEEIDAARARVAATEAQIKVVEKTPRRRHRHLAARRHGHHQGRRRRRDCSRPGRRSSS